MSTAHFNESQAVNRFSELVSRKVNSGDISVSELSRRAKVSRQHLYRIMDGDQAPTLATAEKIGKILGISISITDKKRPAAG
jgi:DNA-binding phage protein